MKQLKILFVLFAIIFNEILISNAEEILEKSLNSRIRSLKIDKNVPLRTEWERVPLRSQAQRNAGLFGGEGMQMVHSISYAPSNPDIVYFASDTSQVWKSVNGGKSWQSKRNGFRAKGGVSLVVDPLNENVVFVSGSRHKADEAPVSSPVDGIYRTLDGGDSWQLVKQTDYYRGKEGQHFVFDSKSFDGTRHQIIYAGTHAEGLLKSIDGGDTWTTIGLAGIRILDIELNSNTSISTLYVTTNNTGVQGNGLYKVDDGTKSPKITPIGDLPDYPRTIALNAQNKTENDIIYAAVGKYKVYKSSDGGNTFIKKSKWLTVNNKEYKNIDISPADPNYLYVRLSKSGTSNPFYSHDGGETWQKPKDLNIGNLIVKNRVSAYRAIRTAPHPIDRNVALSFMGSTITKTTDGGITWRYSGSGYMGGRRGRGKTSAYFDPANPKRKIFFLIDHGPALTEDGGDTWRFLPVPRIGAKTTPVGTVDPDNPNTIITPVGKWSSQTIIRSTDGGENWQVVNKQKDNYFFMCFHPQDSDFVYAGASSGSWTSQDKGKSWEFIEGKSIRAVFPENGDIVYAIEKIHNKKSILWRSIDRGENWTRLTINPFKEAEDVDIDPHNADRLYAATVDGFYVYDGTKWIETSKSGGIPIDSNIGRNLFSFKSVVVNPMRPDIVYTGMWDPGKGHRKRSIFRSDDYGMTWEDIGYNLGGYSTVFSLAVDLTSGKLHMCTNHGNYSIAQ